MTTRVLLLPAVAAALVAGGCFAPGDNPKADDLPQAPPPREKKSQAELLVGTWNLVKGNPPLDRGFEAQTEFTKDGKVTMWINNPPFGRSVQTGTYRLDDGEIRLVMDPPADPTDRHLTIESLTADKLVVSGLAGRNRQIFEDERVTKKKQ